MKKPFFFIISMMLCTSIARAEYYITEPMSRYKDEAPQCETMSDLQYQFLHAGMYKKARPGQPRIEIYHVYEPCTVNCCQCQQVQPCHRSQYSDQAAYVHFPKEYRYQYGRDPMGVGVSEDMRTQDDDVMVDPNMNNQY